jgi:hypothetical protein
MILIVSASVKVPFQVEGYDDGSCTKEEGEGFEMRGTVERT